MVKPLNIAGFSTARFGTWFFLDEYKVLFDVGDGAAAHLGSKCGRVQHVFFTHADRDHLGGLIQFNQIAAQSPEPPSYYYPKDSGSFPALKDFLERFDPYLNSSGWTPVNAGVSIEIGKNLSVEIGENDHIAHASRGDGGQTKSLDFSLVETRRKLRAAYVGLQGAEIARLRTDKGDEHITEPTTRRLFGFSGDTPRFDVERWQGTEVLVHEATFIAPDTGDRGHSELGEVISAAARLDLKALILSHFSSRYKADVIRAAIHREAERAAAPFPIYALMPGEVGWNILAGEPVWHGNIR